MTVQDPQRPAPAAPPPAAPRPAAASRWSAGGAADLFRRHPEAAACALIVLLVVVANLPYLLHLFNPNPINQVSGIGHPYRKGLLPGVGTIDPNNGANSQALGHRAALDWWHGVAPWWNHYAGAGSPLAGDMQSAALFPLTLLLGFSTGQLFFHIALEIVAGLSTYFLLRRLSVNQWAALAGGSAFALNGTFAWFAHAAANPVAFLPVLLLGIENARGAASDCRRWGWGLIAFGLALSLYSGFPETAYIDGLLAGLWALVRAASLGHPRAVRFIAKVAAGGFAGVLMAAPILVAFGDYLADGYTGTHNGAIGHAFLVPGALPMTTLPYVYGPIFAFHTYDRLGTLGVAWGNVGGFVTTAVLLLAVVGMVGRRHRALRLTLGTWVALFVGRSFGVPLALSVVNAVPQMVNTAVFRYAPVSCELAMIVLAALALDDIATGEASRARIVVGAGISLLTLAYLAHAALPLIHRLVGAPHHRAWAVGSVSWGGSIVLAIGAAAVAVQGPKRSRLLAALVVVDVLVLFMIPEFSAPRRASLDPAPVAFLRSNLGSARYYTLGPLGPNYGSYFGLSSANQYDLPLPKRWTDYVKNLDANADPVDLNGWLRINPAGPSATDELIRNLANFEEIGVKYVLMRPDAVFPAVPGIRTVFSNRTLSILELPDPKPFAEDPSGHCRVTVISPERLRASCAGPGTLLRRELYMPGWHASVNRNPVAVSAHGPLFQSIALPAGDSTVEFGFAPPHMSVALLALLIGLLAVTAPLVLERLLTARK